VTMHRISKIHLDGLIGLVLIFFIEQFLFVGSPE
jgi:hypothetical protein